MGILLSTLDNEAVAGDFKDKVKKSEAPAYPKAILHPTCLREIGTRVKKTIKNPVEIMREVALLCANAVQFNGEESDVGQDAIALWAKFDECASLVEPFL
jgi:hypothetical protein